MAWIELHDNIWEHHKTVKVCAELAISDVQLVGHLVSLWQFAMRNAPDTGDLEPWDDSGIARAARWTGDAVTLCNALRNANLLDGYKIHDWDEFTLHFKASRERRERKRDQVRERVKNYRQKQCNAVGNAPVTQCNADTKPNQTKPNLTKPTKPTEHPGFDTFWKAYPNKKAKGAARRLWNGLKPNSDLQAEMLAAIGKQSRSEQWLSDGGKYIPLPTTWLNQERWEDELKPSLSSRPPEVFVPTVIPEEEQF